jgi:uncharacterized protein (DUF1800 family)
MVSLADSNLYEHTRAYANYLDTLNKHAFGNYRTLLEEIALSPVMGIYLSHMRNRKEDPATGRVPDENFAREVMQLFTIGLVELNADGTPRLGSDGRALETYDNADVMALAKVFTGWSWAFPDSQLTENRFRWGWPDYSLAGDAHRPAEDEGLPRPVLHRRGAAVCRQALGRQHPPGWHRARAAEAGAGRRCSSTPTSAPSSAAS